MKTAVYLAHLNPLTISHVEIIEELLKENRVVVMPVIFIKNSEEINTKSFPFNFEIRKKMLKGVFDNSIEISDKYTFYAPFKKYLPPLLSPKSWKLRKQILSDIKGEYFTYTGDKAEGMMLRIYGLKPKVGLRKHVSASSVKEELYQSQNGQKVNWEENVPKVVADIIKDNWDVVENFAVIEDRTKKVAGMKFPIDGYTSEGN